MIHAGGTFEQVRPAKGAKFTLEELQGIVGGYIERAHTHGGAAMWVNEDGIRLGLPVNHLATVLMWPELPPPAACAVTWR